MEQIGESRISQSPEKTQEPRGFEWPPNPGYCSLALAFGVAQVRSVVARFSPGQKIRPSALGEYWQNRPDSKIAREAEDFVRTRSPGFLTNHCLRSYCFAKGLADRNSVRADDEILYLACLLHDIGLAESGSGGLENFEERGAAAAQGFLRLQGYPDERTRRIADAIAWHTVVGKATDRAAETVLTHLGTGMDVIGFNAHVFEAGFIDELVRLVPRLGFKKAFLALLEEEAARNPRSRIAKYLRLGFARKIETAPFCE